MQSTLLSPFEIQKCPDFRSRLYFSHLRSRFRDPESLVLVGDAGSLVLVVDAESLVLVGDAGDFERFFSRRRSGLGDRLDFIKNKKML